ncbi:diaminopimelate decarboxylase [Sedimenticola selenatireducens]|uniref:Diaminopimelate decarboxylase n=1 Tax=Sedimenticola selenatireducens TaxID=191960 RepID=A0A557SEP2_9GAMM|nr:diaminopimelate decarboxylase [Sedimenticola selenatireducens]TVO75831.1 diaminopimelate decarboxylase [Sedimenticola selenatireducens]TVT63690.1 MAG: diaminopimelate decarboxylase [Sedimenticola selenatireducens]
MNNTLHYTNQQLHMESVSLDSIAEQVSTPFYCYSRAVIEQQISACKNAFKVLDATLHYAVKANSNLAVLRIMAGAGLGADVVSAGEMERALMAGIAAEKIIFSGVGKRKAEMLAALEAGIAQFNLESISELKVLMVLCEQQKKRAGVSVRINPDVDGKTHRHITTGVKGSKFGIPMEQLSQALGLIAQSDHLTLRGLAVHIGSQIVTTEPYRAVCERLRDWIIDLRGQGHAIQHLDLGGGFGIDYGDGQVLSFENVAQVMRQALQGVKDLKIAIEPGRSLVGDAGVLVSEVIYRKEVEPVPFLILDAGMNDLMRPALYQASHSLVPLISMERGHETVSVVGPICESSDSFHKEISLPRIEEGERIALLQAGAYGAVMASGYNSRDIIPEVLVDSGEYALVRRRINHRDLLELEQVS